MKTTIQQAIALQNEQALALQHATEIMEGFLSRFPAPECVEQAEIVSRANAWLANFAAKAISQQNQNDTQNHTD
jgi:hypothetical protein